MEARLLFFGMCLLYSTVHTNGRLENYEKHKRPNFGTGQPDNCNFTIVIYKVGPISENSMTMKSDLYVRQMWMDRRLLPYYYNQSESSSGSEVDIDEDGDEFVSITEGEQDMIWLPSIYFSDGVQEDTPDEMSVSRFTRLFPSGRVLLSRRVILESRCNFDLSFFPMDTQQCYICFESYQFDTKEQTIQWAGEGKSAFLINSETAVFNVHKEVELITTMSQWPLYGVKQVECISADLNYSSLCMRVRLERKLPIYLVTMYVPSMALVVLSWVAFWLDKDATNARGGLAVTTILAQVTLMTGTANRFPQVSHVKLGDIYMMVNFFFVFCTLLEFAVINKQQSRLKRIKDHEQQQKDNATTTQNDTQDSSHVGNDLGQKQPVISNLNEIKILPSVK